MDIHLMEKVRVEEKSVIALETMLGYNISKLDLLENFFFQSKTYIERLKNGQMSFEELVEKYNWKKRAI